MVGFSSGSRTVFAIGVVSSVKGDSCSEIPLLDADGPASTFYKITLLRIGEQTLPAPECQRSHDTFEPSSQVSRMTGGEVEMVPDRDSGRVSSMLPVDICIWMDIRVVSGILM